MRLSGIVGAVMLALVGAALLAGAALLFGVTFHAGTDTALHTAVNGLEQMRLPGATTFAVLGLVTLLLALRRGSLWWRARRPHVQITNFGWTGTTEGTEPEAAWITSLFRDKLAALQLDALDALPERAPGAPLMEIFAGIGEATAVGKALAAVARVVNPDCAYAVWGTLHPYEAEATTGGYISVDLVDRTRRNQTLISVTLQDEDWEICTREAAMAVAGALYPRVHRRHQGPWTHWNRPVPSRLVMDYHDAADYERDDRLEEALGAYKRALERDPLNPHIRICIAMIQERLGLYLDAWAGYYTLTEDPTRRAWKGSERRVRLLAQYRLAVIVGAEQVGGQWMREDREPVSERDEERATLRKELADVLVREELFAQAGSANDRRLDRASACALWSAFDARLQQMALGGERPAPDDVRGRLHALLGGDPDKPVWRWSSEGPLAPLARADGEPLRNADGEPITRADLLNELLQILSLRYFEELRGWLRPWPPLRGLRRWWIHRPPLSHWFARRAIPMEALQLSFTCVRLRMRATRWKTRGRRTDEAAFEALVGGGPFKPSRHSLRLPPRRWRHHGLPGRRDDDWLPHYNAACTVAIPLLPELEDADGKRVPLPLGKLSEEQLIEAAIIHLDRYAETAGSGRIASQEGWIGAEDPDLAGLTESERFRAWARAHLSERLPEYRPKRTIDVAHFLRVVLQAGAEAMADAWKERAVNEDPAANAEGWWCDDDEMWRVVDNACQQYRTWRHRLAAIEQVNKRRAALGQPILESRPSWRERAGGENEDEHYHEKGLEKIATAIGIEGDASHMAPIIWTGARLSAIREARERGALIDPEIERRAALRAARIWRRLARALDPDAASEALSELRAEAPLAEELPQWLDLDEGGAPQLDPSPA